MNINWSDSWVVFVSGCVFGAGIEIGKDVYFFLRKKITGSHEKTE